MTKKEKKLMWVTPEFRSFVYEKKAESCGEKKIADILNEIARDRRKKNERKKDWLGKF